MRSPPKARNSAVARALRSRSDPLFDLTAALPRLIEADVGAVVPNPNQPRRSVDEVALRELAASIDAHGLLQPIVVQEHPAGGYLLVAGQRRLLAHRLLGRDRIAALLTTGRPDELALIENLQREALPPLDEAEALAALQGRYGYTQDQLAKAMAKAKSTISELLSLNALPEVIKNQVRTSERPISKSVLIEIARLGDEEAQLAFWHSLRAGPRPTVRQTRAAKRNDVGPDGEQQLLVRRTKRLLAALQSLDRAAVVESPELADVLTRLKVRLEVVLAG